MTPRLLASAALGIAVVLTATGCNMLAPQSTTIDYSPSDGINVSSQSGPLDVRNALVVTNEAGTAGNLVAAIVNSSDDSETLTIQVGEGADALTETVRVDANSVVSLGTEDTEPLLLTPLETEAGSTLEVFFQSGDGQGTVANVPVLDGRLAYLEDFVPEED